MNFTYLRFTKYIFIRTYIVNCFNKKIVISISNNRVRVILSFFKLIYNKWCFISRNRYKIYITDYTTDYITNLRWFPIFFIKSKHETWNSFCSYIHTHALIAVEPVSMSSRHITSFCPPSSFAAKRDNPILPFLRRHRS